MCDEYLSRHLATQSHLIARVSGISEPKPMLVKAVVASPYRALACAKRGSGHSISFANLLRCSIASFTDLSLASSCTERTQSHKARSFSSHNGRQC
jgi:hypothetical protein